MATTDLSAEVADIKAEVRRVGEAILDRLEGTTTTPTPDPEDPPVSDPTTETPSTPPSQEATGIKVGKPVVVCNDWSEVQPALDSCDYNSPRKIVMNFHRTPFDVPSLHFPQSAHTDLVGLGERRTEIYTKAGQPAIVFPHDNVHSNLFEDFSVSYQEQSPWDVPTFQYGMDRPDEMGCYHQRFRDITINNGGSGWGMVRGHGKQTMWNQEIVSVRLYGMSGSVLDLNPSEAIGMPIVKVQHVTAINTGQGWSKRDNKIIPRTRNERPAFWGTAAEMHVSHVDIEGWYGELFRIVGGAICSFEHFHVEHHRLDGRDEFNQLLGWISNGPASLRDFTIAGMSEGGYEPSSGFSIDHGGQFSVLNGMTAWTGAVGKPFAKAYNGRYIELTPVMRPFGGGFDG